MDYSRNKEILRAFYSENGIINHFEKDNQYLESAFHEITDIWFRNLEQIKEVRYLMIAEAPLWGKDKSYIYNPDTKNTSFFHKGNLEYVLNTRISDKMDFINRCNDIGLLVIDVSPFALNTDDTVINYAKTIPDSNKLKPEQYKALIEKTIPVFFEEKMKLITPRVSPYASVFYRYGRVRILHDIISEVLIANCVIEPYDEIPLISKRGGMIDKTRFSSVLQPLPVHYT